MHSLYDLAAPYTDVLTNAVNILEGIDGLLHAMVEQPNEIDPNELIVLAEAVSFSAKEVKAVAVDLGDARIYGKRVCDERNLDDGRYLNDDEKHLFDYLRNL